MTSERNLGRELLKQEELEPGKAWDADRERIRRTLVAETRAIRRLKWLVAILWTFIGIYIIHIIVLVFFGVQPLQTSFTLSTFLIIAYVVVPYAVICTVRLYLKIRSASLHEIQATLLDMQKQLQQLSKKD